MDVRMRKGFLLSTAALVAVVHFWTPQVWAQEEDSIENSADVDQIEAEIEKKSAKTATPEIQTDKEKPLEDFSGLGKLAPFSQVSVIQRRFLPKTGRFEFFGGLVNVVNDPWFTGIGLDGRLGYHLNETWGIELTQVLLSNSQRQAIKDLHDQNGVNTESIVTAKNYSGAAAVWTPIYGKMGMFNRRIVPFDMYFALGGGSTSIEGGTGGSTIHFGTGQIFAITKGIGFRWDFTWNSYNATPKTGQAQNFNNLMLSFGASFFFPGAKYR
jgi:outer membrane beta-barrel protein